jgi:hypothetical protein
MILRTIGRAIGCAVLGVLVGVAVPAAAQRAPLQMLDGFQDGRWELRIRGGGIERLCLHDARQLIQLRHPNLRCERLVVEDSASSVTVQYTCRGRGYGRTHIRRESQQLFQMEAQGIADGLPFEFAAEGRRVGECQS